ncbi:MAG: quinolinate synthase NadA [Candidatus Brennerbacteria bacterium]|nr:quinolinate synthase NadA [Candidatus Brennerbacteria bacterium]
MNAKTIAVKWHELFSRYAEDLYPGRYTLTTCFELAEKGLEIKRLAKEKGSFIAVHNYLYPEFHEIADKVGDSLGLSFTVREACAKRIDFESVFFMGATAKIIVGDSAKVFTADHSSILGCSLVFGTDYQWIENWKKNNPEGILITYINSDVYTKSISHFISTSRNTDKIIAYAAKLYPDRKILVLPDKFLGFVMKTRAIEILKNEGMNINQDLIDIYQYFKGEYRAACYVHAEIGPDAAEIAMLENNDAELIIHPECGCASSCLYKLQTGEIPNAKAYFLSTEQMVEHARNSHAKKFIVATEKGMVYRLRKEIPGKEFIPISEKAECRFMKANTFDKLLRSLMEDRLEIVLCDDCCDPKHPYEDEQVIHIQKSVARKSKEAIDKMLTIV